MHQNRASPFASDFYRRRGYRRELRSEDHLYPFSSQKKSRFASDFLRRGNRASWGLAKSRDFSGSGKIRKILVSVKFLSAIPGPEMAAPILWTPGKKVSVLQEKLFFP